MDSLRIENDSLRDTIASLVSVGYVFYEFIVKMYDVVDLYLYSFVVDLSYFCYIFKRYRDELLQSR